MKRICKMFSVIAIVLALFSCAEPQYNLKRVALVPAPFAPSRSSVPQNPGTVALLFEANPFFAVRPSYDMFSYPSSVGDPGLLLANTQIGVSMYRWTSAYFDIGGQFRWSAEEWTMASATDVPNFPSGVVNGISVWGIGMKFNLPLNEARTARFSPMLELNLTSIPEATFRYDSHRNQWNYVGTETETWLFPALFFQFDKTLSNEPVDLYGFMGVQRSLTNTGFDYDTTDATEYSVKGTMVICGGVGADYCERDYYFGGGIMFSNTPQFKNDELSASFFFRTGILFGNKERSFEE